jgi:N-methylhydantoinase B/oxoprolinase/acetone carboxylase alpha subunit
MRREYELLADATVVRRFDKARFPPQGLAGGGRGYGEARMRECAAVDRHVAEGYVSAALHKAGAADDRG